jgi:hypothetical protein
MRLEGMMAVITGSQVIGRAISAARTVNEVEAGGGNASAGQADLAVVVTTQILSRLSRWKVQAILLKLLLIFTLSNLFSTSAATTQNIVELALREFKAESVVEMKARIFGSPITVFDAKQCQQAIASLPEEVRRNRVIEGHLWRRVGRLLEPVLQVHNRVGSMELFLYRHNQPLAFVWRGCVLGISDSLASSLADEELAGVIAHEIGHAYFMEETLAARKSGDAQVMRVVELKCDAVAMLTLKLMAQDPAKFISGLWKIYSRSIYKGYEPRSWRHPQFAERERFSRRFINLLKE